jgi:hypothetical protein
MLPLLLLLLLAQHVVLCVWEWMIFHLCATLACCRLLLLFLYPHSKPNFMVLEEGRSAAFLNVRPGGRIVGIFETAGCVLVIKRCSAHAVLSQSGADTCMLVCPGLCWFSPISGSVYLLRRYIACWVAVIEHTVMQEQCVPARLVCSVPRLIYQGSSKLCMSRRYAFTQAAGGSALYSQQ